jgi:putative transposase
MFKRLKVKLYPTKDQIEMLEQHFNGYRYAYNASLYCKNYVYENYRKNLSGFDLQKELLELRKESDWLINCKAECIRDAGTSVAKTFDKYFNQLKNGTIERQQKRYLQNRAKKGLEVNWGKYYSIGKPKFKSKKGEQSFTAQQAINCKNNKLSFYKNKKRPPGLSEEQVDGLVFATQDLEHASGGQAPLDLRSIENLGRRKNGQIVIIDPFSL